MISPTVAARSCISDRSKSWHERRAALTMDLVADLPTYTGSSSGIGPGS